MQRSISPTSSVIPRDVRPIIEYAIHEHPQGLDPQGVTFDTDSTGFSYTTAYYIWEGYQIVFRWDEAGFWIAGVDDKGDYLHTKQRSTWPWPMDPQDRIEATLVVDAIHQHVLDSIT